MTGLRYIGYLLLVLTTVLWGSTALAHPLGNFTINHYAGLELHTDTLEVDYGLDMAEIPTFQTIQQLDTNHNRHPDPEETATFQPQACNAIQSDLSLQLNQTPYQFTLKSTALDFLPGVGGLPTLQLSCRFSAALTLEEAPYQLEFKNNAYTNRLGWREITLTADMPTLSTLSATSLSHRLREYPNDLLKSPPDQRQATITLWPALTDVTDPIPPVQSTSPGFSIGSFSLSREEDPLTRLIHLDHLTPLTLVIALAIAFVWGGLHALTPGHGKTLVGAYLVGSKGTPQHALLLGLTTTITHTAGIFALGLLTLVASQFIITEQLYPWLSALSGVMVISIGITLFRQRLAQTQPPHSHEHHTPEHKHHSSEHEQHTPEHKHHSSAHEHHPPEHKQHHSHALSHKHYSPGHHFHEHNQHHAHDHTHEHEHNQHHAHDHTHEHEHNQHHTHDHSHAPHPHSHNHHQEVPTTWGALIALGISGGILPCPTALVVLLSAIALGRIGFGLALVTSFSFGLASALTGIGLLVIYARQKLDTLPIEIPQTRFLPAMSAAFIALVGVAITTQALMQTKLFAVALP